MVHALFGTVDEGAAAQQGILRRQRAASGQRKRARSGTAGLGMMLSQSYRPSASRRNKVASAGDRGGKTGRYGILFSGDTNVSSSHTDCRFVRNLLDVRVPTTPAARPREESSQELRRL